MKVRRSKEQIPQNIDHVMLIEYSDKYQCVETAIKNLENFLLKTTTM